MKNLGKSSIYNFNKTLRNDELRTEQDVYFKNCNFNDKSNYPDIKYYCISPISNMLMEFLIRRVNNPYMNGILSIKSYLCYRVKTQKLIWKENTKKKADIHIMKLVKARQL